MNGYQHNEDDRKFNMIGYGIISVVVLLIIIASAIAIGNNNEQEMSIVTDSRFLSLDYRPKAVLDQEWSFAFWSEETIEGSGEYADYYYPKVVRWHIYIQDYFDNAPIASQDYRDGFNDYKHPTERIEFSYIFDSSVFEKGVIMLKLRVDLDVGNDTDPRLVRDMVDFEIGIEGLITGTEFFYYVGLPAIFLMLFITRIKLVSAINKRTQKEVKFFNLEVHLAIFLWNKLINFIALQYKKIQLKLGKVIMKPSYYQLEVEANPNWDGYDEFQPILAHVRRNKKVQNDVRETEG